MRLGGGILSWVLTADEAPFPTGVGSVGAQLARTLIAVVLLSVFAWFVLRWASRRGLGTGSPSGAMRVLERLDLDPKHAVYLVEVGERVLLLGVGEHGLSTLADIDRAHLPAFAPGPTPESGPRFREILARYVARGATPARSRDDAAPDAPKTDTQR